jgi:3-isopropylmalate/(R)-2-methylmalate dehydratase large subunit
MGTTIVEKILNKAAGANASAGDIVHVPWTFLMTNDAVAELTIESFEDLGKPVWDKTRTIMVIDHYIPATTENAARTHRLMRGFAARHGLTLFDQTGVCHQMMIEHFVSPGDVVIGTDSHTCTYGGIGAFATGVGSTDGAVAMATGKIWLKIPESIRVELVGRLPEHVHPKDVILSIIRDLGADGATYKALEFTGDGAVSITNSGRLTMCNMAIEAGAKTGIFPPDVVTESWNQSTNRRGISFKSDPDAQYVGHMRVILDELEPQVSCPWTVDKVVPVSELTNIAIDQAFIGSCTNGRIEDLRLAAGVLKKRKIHANVRLLVTPASQTVYRQAVNEGLINIFIDAGAVICNPGCSACFGGQGMLWDGEVCIGTHNRNFRGRMGHKDARVYLASPETVAVSAVAGFIHSPAGQEGDSI